MNYSTTGVHSFDECADCGGKLLIWNHSPWPGHNLSTLYECDECGAVISLADKTGMMIEFLP